MWTGKWDISKHSLILLKCSFFTKIPWFLHDYFIFPRRSHSGHGHLRLQKYCTVVQLQEANFYKLLSQSTLSRKPQGVNLGVGIAASHSPRGIRPRGISIPVPRQIFYWYCLPGGKWRVKIKSANKWLRRVCYPGESISPGGGRKPRGGSLPRVLYPGELISLRVSDLVESLVTPGIQHPLLRLSHKPSYRDNVIKK